MRMVSDGGERAAHAEAKGARRGAEADDRSPTPEKRARYLCWVMHDWTKTLRAMKPTPEDDFPFARDGMLAVDVRKQTMFSLIDTAAMFKAMVHNPPVLVLDEPTAGVDVELRRQLWELVSEMNAQGVTVVMWVWSTSLGASGRFSCGTIPPLFDAVGAEPPHHGEQHRCSSKAQRCWLGDTGHNNRQLVLIVVPFSTVVQT